MWGFCFIITGKALETTLNPLRTLYRGNLICYLEILFILTIKFISILTCSCSLQDNGDPIYECYFCQSLMWFKERIKRDNSESSLNTFSLCCLQGKVVLPSFKHPPSDLKDLFFNPQNPNFKKFHTNIRQYINMFSFTSMGGTVNHSLNSGGGPYTYTLSGLNYHRIGSLLPLEGQAPVYSQLYIHDTVNEIDNRISAVR